MSLNDYYTVGKLFTSRCLFCRSYDGPLMEEEALLGAAKAGLSSPEYVDLCRWLVCRLKPLCDLEEDVTSGPGETDLPHE